MLLKNGSAPTDVGEQAKIPFAVGGGQRGKEIIIFEFRKFYLVVNAQGVAQGVTLGYVLFALSWHAHAGMYWFI